MLRRIPITSSNGVPISAAVARSIDQFRDNLDWFCTHAGELDVYQRYQGRHIAVADAELFVGDSAEEAARLALEKHPGTQPFLHHVQPETPAPRVEPAKPKFVCSSGPMPPELARQLELAKRNADWFDEHALELDVFNRYRGKFVAIAGGELFVADSASEARRLALEKHPDDCPHHRYIPKMKARRIYAYQRRLANV